MNFNLRVALANPIVKSVVTVGVGALGVALDTAAQQAMTGTVNGTQVGAVGVLIGTIVHNLISKYLPPTTVVTNSDIRPTAVASAPITPPAVLPTVDTATAATDPTKGK